ncbi:MAG: sigma-70 family RNA polymerase sigma factor [Kiritimatiellae bacterium]|nr:sigma-70 family RNA polymerase sigma factor [Kiritimatiellia bacterium]
MKTKAERFEAYWLTGTGESLLGLLEGWQDAVYNMCYQVLGGAAGAAEAAREVLLRTLDHMDEFTEPHQLERWLYRLCYTVSLNILRRDLSERRQREASPTPAGKPSEATSFVIHQHVADLEESLRTLVIQYLFEGRTLQELAAEYGCAASDVWKRVENAKQALVESLPGAGLAAAVPSLDPFFQPVVPVKAPPDLLRGEVLDRVGAMTGSATGSGPAAVASRFGSRFVRVLAVMVLAAAGFYLGKRLFPIGAPDGRKGAPDEEEPARAPDGTRVEPERGAGATPAAELERVPAPRRDVGEAAVGPGPGVAAALAKVLATALDTAEAATRWDRLRAIGIGLADADFTAAYALLSDKADAAAFLQGVLRQWVSRAPRDALQWAQALGDAELAAAVFSEWLLVDFGAARTMALALPPGAIRELVLLRVQVLEDPEKAVAWAEAADTASDRRLRLSAVAGLWGTYAPEAAAAWALQLSGAGARAEALASVARAWAGSDIEAAMQFRDQVVAEYGGQDLVRAIAEGAAGHDPAYAAGLAVLDPYSGASMANAALDASLERWARVEPKRAAAFVEALPAGAMRRSAAVSVLIGWAEAAPRNALAWGDQVLSLGPADAEALQRVAVAAAGKAPEWIVGRIERAYPPAVRVPALRGVFSRWGGYAPRAALASANGMSPDFVRADCVWSVISGWLCAEPATVAALAPSAPGWQERPDIARQIAEQWLLRDANAALEWATALSPGPSRDAALAVLAAAASR